MDKIEIGEYVRTKAGNIDKLKGITNEDIYLFEKSIIRYTEENIKNMIAKHSKDIIDILEVGDFVNGYKIIDFDLTYFNGIDRRKEPKRTDVVVDNGKYKYENYIKREYIQSIVTKEMFVNMEYKVGV